MFLRSVGAALPVAVAGCSESAGDDPSTEQSTTRPTPTGGTTSEPAVSASLTRYEYAVSGTEVGPNRLPIGGAVRPDELGEDAEAAIRAAVETGAFETDDPSDQLLRDVEALGLVEYEDAYYSVSHTFTEYVVDVTAVPEAGDDATVATHDAVREEQAVQDAIEEPMPMGPQRPQRPHRTLFLPSELEAFLDEYTHVRSGDALYRIDVQVERHRPPYTLTVERASEEALYGGRLVHVRGFASGSRELLLGVLESIDERGAGWGDGVLYSNDVPREVEREFDDGAYVRFADTPVDSVYRFDVRHVDWNRPPLNLSVSAVEAPAGVTFGLENTTDGSVRLTNDGVAPFGVLWANPDDGAPRQLWSPDYGDAPELQEADGVFEADGSAEFELHSNQTITRTYRLARNDGDDEHVPPGTYELRGVLAGIWNRPGSRERPGNQSVVYPFGVTIVVERD